ncbi:8-oxoguanine DNA glycosylase OGG fold protein [Streptomyces nigra]|uniref:8-oxoguanine DNA glycosylase OGG fold protein n=1 Tax=Streptomyces nigra TaxID=1827580 RepID=UPI003827BDD4
MMEQLRKLVVRYGDCEQKPVRFRPETWRSRLESHGAAHVLDIGVGCASGSSGDRLISRGDLAHLRDRVGDDPDSLRDLFVAVMIWGSGTTNGRGPRYTEAALSDARMPTVLRTTRDAVRDGDLSRAYQQFVLNGVGRSFFTKWFAVVDDRDATCDRALILDDRVFRSLNALGWSSWKAAGTRRWPTRYATYVSSMHGWASSLGVTADWLEWLLFHLNGHVDEP